MEWDTLNSIRNRPRFKLKTLYTPKEFTEALKINLEKNKEKFIGRISIQESFIEVKTLEYPIWKPRLTLRAETNPEEKTTEIRGIFGPRPAVWTLFMFFYIVFGTMAVIFSSLYYSMYLVNSKNDIDYYWAGAASILNLLAVLITYIAAKIGYIKSKKEIEKLREFTEKNMSGYEA